MNVQLSSTLVSKVHRSSTMLVKLPFCVIFLFFSVIIVATIHTEWQDVGQSLRAVDESGPVYRLNNSTEPTYYELWMETQVQDEIFNYSGRVIIKFRVLEPTRIVTIHSLVKIQSYKILKDQDSEVGVSEIEFNNKTEILSFILSDEIKTDSNYLLDIHFTGILNDQSHGFFYRRFTEKTNEVSYIATTYLHSGNARFAFPCYDEPRYRTIFLIHVTHHPSMEAISNMPVDYTTNKLVLFTEFPKVFRFKVLKFLALMALLQLPSKKPLQQLQT